MLRAAHTITEFIGHTPLVRLNRLSQEGAATIYAKAEHFNPGGSVKDRICLNMLDEAERQGRLKPGATIVEPTSGNTGIGLALISAVRDYKLILVMPESMSMERASLLSSYGAQLVLTAAWEGMKGSIKEAEGLIASNPDYFMPDQFSNPANPAMHRKTTGPEIWESMDGQIDAFVTAVGTGGTITGCGEYFKQRKPGIKVIAVEPAGSPVLSGGDPGPHRKTLRCRLYPIPKSKSPVIAGTFCCPKSAARDRKRSARRECSSSAQAGLAPPWRYIWRRRESARSASLTAMS